MNSGMIIVAVLAVVAVVAVSVSGQRQGYELDPAKVDERYNLILGIVGKGIPYGSHSAYKPKIGGAYAGYSGNARGYKAPTNNYGRGYQAPTNYGRGYQAPTNYAQTYKAPTNYGQSYKAPTSYGQVYKAPTTNYGQGYNVAGGYQPYGQAARGYNNAGGYSAGPRAQIYPTKRGAPVYPSQSGVVYPTRSAGYDGATGYKYGGGRVHPIFNNDLLYRPKVNKGGLGSFDSTDPVFIGGTTGKTTDDRLDYYGAKNAPGSKVFTGGNPPLVFY